MLSMGRPAAEIRIYDLSRTVKAWTTERRTAIAVHLTRLNLVSQRTEVTQLTNGNIQNHAAFIWSVADLLRGDYKQSDYGKVILPLTVLRRLDSVLEPTKNEVLKRAEELKGRGLQNVDDLLNQVTGHGFNNTS